MKFSKYNNPNRKTYKTYNHSRSYINEQKSEMYEMLSKAKTEAEKEMIIKSYQISINPYQK